MLFSPYTPSISTFSNSIKEMAISDHDWTTHRAIPMSLDDDLLRISYPLLTSSDVMKQLPRKNTTICLNVFNERQANKMTCTNEEWKIMCNQLLLIMY